MLPEAISQGCDPVEAIARGQEALQLAVESRIEDGEMLPAPSALDDRLLQRLDADQRREFKLFYLLPVSEAAPSVRLNISLPGDLVQRIDAVAGNYGRSGWLAEAAREKLARSFSADAAGFSEERVAYDRTSRNAARGKVHASAKTRGNKRKRKTS